MATRTLSSTLTPRAGLQAVSASRALLAPTRSSTAPGRRMMVVRAASGVPAKQADEISFKPFEEVTAELTRVEDANLGQAGIDNSFARVGYHPEQELAVNEQINIEYNMSYAYHQVASYFNRDNVALPGLAGFFREASLEERDHAQQLMDFQATRGGRVKLAHITAPQSEFGGSQDRSDALHAMELALSFEKLNFQKLRDLHEVADKHGDAQMADFVESMLAEQVTADYVAELRRVGPGLGVFQWDRYLQQSAADLATPAAQG